MLKYEILILKKKLKLLTKIEYLFSLLEVLFTGAFHFLPHKPVPGLSAKNE